MPTSLDFSRAIFRATVSFTITGTNDAPTVSATAASAFIEAADASAQDLSQSGTVNFDDIDANDVVDISASYNNDIVWTGGSLTAAQIAALTAGTFTASATDAAAPGSTPRSYSANDVALDFLAQGESITFSFTVTATDNNAATDTDTVSFTITGTNDAPTVSATAASAFIEAADASAQDLSQSVTVNFDAIDANDVVDISASYNNDIVWTGGSLTAAQIAALTAGTFTASATDAAAPGSTPWSYSANDVALDFLAQGESITFASAVTRADDNAATDTDTVSFTITGTNDAPTVSATAASAFIEAAHASAQDLSQSGTVNFDDIDANDVVDISASYNNDIVWTGGSLTAAQIAALTAGTFTASATDAAAPGSTPWSYSANDVALDFLAQGESI